MEQPKKKILIVDDNEDLNEMFEIAFEGAGFEVKSAFEGLSAIDIAVKFKPDIILLDIMMPQMNGYEFLVAIRKNTSLRTLIVINSNLEQDADLIKAKELKAVEYLKKSEYSPSECVAKIISFLDLSDKERISILEKQDDKKVLIAKDLVDFKSLQDDFKKKEFIIKSCSDDLSTITQLVEFDPDIIILDFKLPNTDAYEVLDTIINNSSLNVIIIIYSDLFRINDIIRYQDTGLYIIFIRKSEYSTLDLSEQAEKWIKNT